MKNKYSLAIILMLASFVLVTMLVSADDAEKPAPYPTAEEYAEAEADWVTLAEVDRDEPEACTGSTENLLRNPSFEGNYGDYVPSPAIPDCPWGVCFSAQMADDWKPYWQSHNNDVDEGWEMLMPEYKPATSDFTNPVRVHSGARAQQLFTFYGTHRAGIYQQVYNVEAGQNYCLSVWGHSWSSYNDTPYTDLSNHGFLNQKIGVDPQGGRDFNSGNIEWTHATTQYDEYGLFKIEVTAQSDTLTVFFNSQPLWAAKHNDVYWDDAVLVKTGAAVPPVMTVNPTSLAYTAETAVPVQTSAEVAIVIENNRKQLSYTAQVVNSSAFEPTLNIVGETLTVGVDSTGLAAGTHQATIEVVASDSTIDGGKQYITVQIIVAQSDPEVSLFSNRHLFLMDDDAIVAIEDSVVVSLLNTEQLVDASWTATVDTARSDFNPALTTSWGHDGDVFALSFDPSGFALGTYTAWITVRGNDSSFVNTEEFAFVIVISEEIYTVYNPVVEK